jgi:thioredoxin 1
MSILHGNKENFNEIKNSEKTVLIDFFATWCGPCRMIAPAVEEIAAENPEYLVVKIDVDEEPELAMQYGISTIPTLIVMKKGEVITQSIGVKPKAQILDLLKNA